MKGFGQLILTTPESDMVLKHEDDISDILSDVKEIRDLLKSHVTQDNERTVASFRSTLYRLHAEFVDQKYVTTEGLKTFLEMGKIYQAAGGDDIYHDKLEPETLKLPIREN